MPSGPFASAVGVGRAEPEWAALNKVESVVGNDTFAARGEKTEGPLPLAPDAAAVHEDVRAEWRAVFREAAGEPHAE